MHRDTKFGRAARDLKSPASASFSRDAWQQAFVEHGETVSDRRLLRAALLLGTEAEAARGFFDDQHLTRLSPEWSTILAIASHNREYRTVVELARTEGLKAAKDGLLSLDVASNQRVRGPGEQRFTAADLTQVGTDLTENWLFDAAGATGPTDPADDLAPMLIGATQAYSFRKAVNTMWNRVWWDGWHCEIDGDVVRWMPGDREFERLETAWDMRQQSNLMSGPHLEMLDWPTLSPAERKARARPRGVIRIDGKGPEPRVRIEDLNYLSPRMPVHAMERAALDGTHLSDFMGSVLPNVAGATCDDVLLAWHVLLDMGTILSARAPLPEGALKPEDARRLSLVIGRSSIRRAIADALRVDADTADAVTSFLTFTPQTGGRSKAKGNKGLWAAPLVPVPGTDQVALVLSVLATSNPVRRVESWLEKGGLDDGRVTAWPATARRLATRTPVPSTRESRGDRYETIVRHDLLETMAENPVFQGGAGAARGIGSTPDFPHQVDLLVSFGGLCLVGEVKFFLMPADPQERVRYDEKLIGAAQQATTKLAALDARRDVLAAALGIDDAEAAALRLMPIIVTAQGYRFSSRMEGVLVVEAGFLRLYLSGNRVTTGMVFDPLTGRRETQTSSFYESEMAAARNFVDTMERPGPLMRFLDQVTWGETPLATFGERAVAEMTVVEGVDTFESMHARAIAESFRR
jgi:hypothetical protein